MGGWMRSGSRRHGRAHGDEMDVHGVFESREAAFESLKALPNMTVYVDEHGFNVVSRPG